MEIDILNYLNYLFNLATSPFGGAFFLGVLIGIIVCIFVMQKYIIGSKLQAAEDLCLAKLEVLQAKIDQFEPVANKWEAFMDIMERKAINTISANSSYEI